jgi:precorrin-6B methylase 2
MSSAIVSRRLLLILCLSVSAAPAPAQQQKPKPYEPTVGQEGKDVVWVPTSQALVEKMLDMAKVTSRDYVIDLGSGDGRTVIAAAKRGAHALGIEYNPEMVTLSERNAGKEGVSARATFIKADLFETDFSKATVITMFLLPEINLKLRPILLDMRPGTRIVSNSFSMGEWEADATETLEGEECSSWCTALLWIVPAKVQGVWKLSDGELTLKQQFQKISGTLGSTPITNGRLRGTEIEFTAGDLRYSGRVNGSMMQGTMSKGGTWSAIRQ